MVFNPTNPYNDIISLLESIQVQRGTNDIGNEFTEEYRTKFFQELEEKYAKLDDINEKFIDKLEKANEAHKKAIENANQGLSTAQKDILTKIGMTPREISDVNDKFIDEQTKLAKDILDGMKELKTSLDDIESKKSEALQNGKDAFDKKRKEKATQTLNRTFTNGKSDNFLRLGDKFQKNGNALKAIGLGKMGEAMESFGKGLSGAAGKLGAFGLVIQAGCKVFEQMTKLYQIDTKRLQEQAAIKLEGQKFELQKQNMEQNVIMQMQQAVGQNAISKAEIYGNVGNEGIQVEADAYVKSHQMMAKLPMDIKGAAYDVANAAIDLGAGVMSFNKNAGNVSKQAALMDSTLNSQIDTLVGTYKNDINLMKGNLVRDSAMKNERSERMYNKSKTEAWFGWFPYVAWDKANLERELTLKEYDVKGKNTQAELQTKAANNLLNLTNTQTQLENQLAQSKINIESKTEDIYINAAKEIAHAWMDMTQAINNEFLKMETASFKMGREMGLTGKQLQSYSMEMVSVQRQVATWGKNLEWMQKMQSSYQETTGRNIELTGTDFELSAGIGTLVGDDIVANLNAGMEIFNTSVTDSNIQFYKMYQTVSRIGLNGKKYAKDLVNNLKLAEKYNFKGGVSSLMEMSKWAQNMRFNVGSLDGMLDKVHTGGLEGVIKQSAEMQVLGGNFAMGSDPMAMAYESYMDPEGYAKRMNQMIAGQGVFNSKTGEVSFGIASQQIMKQFAASSGQDYKDVLNQARQEAKIKNIKQSVGDKFSEDELSLIANKANFSKERGRWEINLKDGKGLRGIDTLSKEEIAKIQPDVAAEDIPRAQLQAIEYIKGVLNSVFSVDEEMTNHQESMKSQLEDELYPEFKDTNETMSAAMVKGFDDNFEEYKKQALDNMAIIKNSPKDFKSLFAAGNDKIDTKVEELKTVASNISSSVIEVGGKANNLLSTALNTLIPALKDKLKDADTPIWKKFKFEVGTALSSELKAVFFKYATNRGAKGVQSAFGNDTVINSQTAQSLNLYLRGHFLKNPADIDEFRKEVFKTVTGLDPANFEDGMISQNGAIAKISSEDQVLAAKSGGPIDKLLGMVASGVSPRPSQYNSPVYTSSVGGSTNNSGTIEVSPIQISLNGNLQMNGGGSSVDIGSQLTSNPEFIRAMTQIISCEVEKKVNGGRVVSILNKGMPYTT